MREIDPSVAVLKIASTFRRINGIMFINVSRMYIV